MSIEHSRIKPPLSLPRVPSTDLGTDLHLPLTRALTPTPLPGWAQVRGEQAKRVRPTPFPFPPMCTCMHFVRFHRVVNPWLTVGNFPEKEFVENLYQSKGSVTMHEHLVQLSHHHLFPTHPPPPLHQRGEGWRATRRGFCAVRPLPHLCHSEGRYAPGGRVRVRVCKHTDSSICLRAQSDNPHANDATHCPAASATGPVAPP